MWTQTRKIESAKNQWILVHLLTNSVSFKVKMQTNNKENQKQNKKGMVSEFYVKKITV